MKWIGLIFAGLITMVACNNTQNQEQKTADVPKEQQGEQSEAPAATSGTDLTGAVLEVSSDSYDFGAVKEGEKVEHEFMFTNTGDEPLIVSRVQASCGCTTPEYSKNPVPPGETGKVKVVFNSAGQMGKQHKVITVTSNAVKPNTLLHLRGEVKK